MQGNSLRLIWFLVRPYKLQLLLLFVLSLLVGALEAANVAAIYPILSTAFAPGVEQENTILQLFRGIADLLPIANSFLAYCVVFLIIAFLAFAAKILSINYRAGFGARLVERNQAEIFDRVINADYQYFLAHKQGELIYNIWSAPPKLTVLVNSVTELASQIVLSISILVFLFSISWQGTLVVLMVGAVYYAITRWLGEKVTYTSAAGEMGAIREGMVILNEAISGIKQVKAFSAAEEWMSRFGGVMKERLRHLVRRSKWRQYPTPALMLVLYLAVGTIAVSVKLIATGNVLELVPVFGTFAFAIFRLFPILGTVGIFIMQIMGTLPNCEVVYAIRSEELTHIRDGSRKLPSFKSEIKFENVTFGYNRRSQILKNVSVTFPKGTTTAIVGRSGVGKTTAINLLLRLFEPTEGVIRVDGMDLREYKFSSWLGKIGYVSQDTFIFNDTVRNNIIFRSEGYPEQEIIEAATYADAHSFITELQEGYDTPVGDRGLKLSSGQGQRLAVARAMIRKPEILIFDEATNALDSISEASVQKAIDEISKDHTVIVIAHRLSSIINADNVIVLGDGRILEQGTHDELMKRKGAYWELYRSQS